MKKRASITIISIGVVLFAFAVIMLVSGGAFGKNTNTEITMPGFVLLLLSIVLIILGFNSKKINIDYTSPPKKSSLTEKQKEVVRLYKEKTAKPCYEIKAIKDAAITALDSSIGGPFYMPLGENAPIDGNGCATEPFVQINFDGVDLEGFPKAGILQVFMSNQCAYEPADNVVRFYPEIKPNYSEYKWENPNSGDAEWVAKPIKIKCEKSTAYPSLNDVNDKILLEIYNEVMQTAFTDLYDENKEAYNVITSAIYLDTPGTTVGGYVHSTQGNEEIDYGKEEALVLINDLDDWNEGNICIGDAGTMWAIIKKTDLAKGNISTETVGIDWDCG
jgi:uncharacterized protein YwqG